MTDIAELTTGLDKSFEYFDITSNSSLDNERRLAVDFVALRFDVKRWYLVRRIR